MKLLALLSFVALSAVVAPVVAAKAPSPEPQTQVVCFSDEESWYVLEGGHESFHELVAALVASPSCSLMPQAKASVPQNPYPTFQTNLDTVINLIR